jgi:hypothetical protein
MPKTAPKQFEPGMLLELKDETSFKDPIELLADAHLTVRTFEDKDGFKWESPTQAFKCVDIVDKDFGKYVTGFNQWVVKAKNTDQNCEEKVVLKTKDGKGENVITVNVKRGFCPKPATACAKDTIQNLDIDNCKCEPLAPGAGKVYDVSTLKPTNPPNGYTFYFGNEEEFTLREWALSTGGYEWSLPKDHSWAKCLQPVGDGSYDDKWGRYRQVMYKASVANCKDTLVRV